MSATIIDGSPAWLDEADGQYQNRIETDRVVWWQAAGARQGIVRGFEHSVVPGQMALEFAPGLALVEERDALDALGTHRGYVVWSDTDQLASFDVASAGDRNDAVVIAFVDMNAGSAALGTGTTTVGGQIVVVPGVSGSTTPRTDAEIAAYVGSGGWMRYADVVILAGSTEIGSIYINRTPESTGTLHRARRSRSTAQSIPNNVFTDLAFTATDYDRGDLVYASTFVVRRDGLYVARSQGTWSSDFGGSRRMQLLVNGAFVTNIGYDSVGAIGVSVDWEGELVAGDVVKFQVFQNSGAALDLASSWAAIREIP